MGSIRRNAEKFSALTGTRLCAVVKANAYGHGAEEVAAALSDVADCFAVALWEEGLAIRAAAQGKDVLVLTPPLCEEDVYAIASAGLIASVPDLYTARLCAEICRKYRVSLRVHIKVNTGMNRYGCDIFSLGKLCKYLQETPCVQVIGIYSHLYTCTEEISFLQRERFVKMRAVCKRYFPSVAAHLGATYGALLGKEFAFDMLRVGLGLYGYLPDGLQGRAKEVGTALRLEKGMSIFTQTAAERKYSYGGAGYGLADTEGLKKISVRRFGYADGFLRRKENGIAEKKRIQPLCMDACICKGGRRGVWTPVLIDADEIAKATDTISYEVLCAATRRAEFIYDYE